MMLLGVPASKGVKRPNVIHLVVTKDVNIVIVGADPEAAITHAVPRIENFFNLASLPPGPDREAKRPFVGPVAGVAFDFEVQAHGTDGSDPAPVQ